MIRIGCDIGTKNFALCARDAATGAILRWQCDSIGNPKTPVHILVRNLNRVLDEFVEEQNAVICIEKQPPFARTISHLLMGATAMWAEAHSVQWELVSPVQRGGTYRERKAASVRLVRSELEASQQHKFLTWFETLRKKDDAADSYFLAWAGSGDAARTSREAPQ